MKKPIPKELIKIWGRLSPELKQTLELRITELKEIDAFKAAHNARFKVKNHEN